MELVVFLHNSFAALAYILAVSLKQFTQEFAYSLLTAILNSTTLEPGS